MKYKIILLVVLGSFLVACSSVPSVTNAQGQPVELNLNDYATVDVKAFSITDEGGEVPATAGSGFAEMVASYILKTGRFSEDGQKSLPGKSLVISGDITGYKKGNPYLREWVGFGAGTSEFYATVYFTDGGSGELLGQMLVEESSNGKKRFDLTGNEAIGTHLTDAAIKIAVEVGNAKLANAHPETAK